MTPEQAKRIFNAFGLEVSVFKDGKEGDRIYEVYFPEHLLGSGGFSSLHNIYYMHGGLGYILVWSAEQEDAASWADVALRRREPEELIKLVLHVRRHNTREIFKGTKIAPGLVSI